MNSVHKLYLLHALSPIHIGVDDAVGAIDLPTMRERHTGYPLVPGSSVKGVLREAAEQATERDNDEVLAVFGPTQATAGDYRSGIVITDAQLLALPVRSLCGTFAWVTCYDVLRRLERDASIAGLSGTMALRSPRIEHNQGLIPSPNGQLSKNALLVPDQNEKQVFLEEVLLNVEPNQDLATLAKKLGEWLWPDESEETRDFFRQRLLVVHDDLFSFFTRVGMETRARVKIDPATGTAERSGPWNEEYLPAESLLYGLAVGRATYFWRRPENSEDQERAKKDGIDWKAEKSIAMLQGLVAGTPLLRFGGNSTIGLGRARFLLV